jgi:prophage regulatory protein
MKILRTPKVVERVGLSRTQIWRLERVGDFPKRIALGPGSVGWLEHEVDTWIETRAAARGNQPVEPTTA